MKMKGAADFFYVAAKDLPAFAVSGNEFPSDYFSAGGVEVDHDERFLVGPPDEVRRRYVRRGFLDILWNGRPLNSPDVMPL